MFTGDEVKSQDDKDAEDGESSRIFVFLDKVVATKDILRSSYGRKAGGNAGKGSFGDDSQNRVSAPRHLWRNTYWSLQYMMSETGDLCVFFGYDSAHQTNMQPEWVWEGEVKIEVLVDAKIADKFGLLSASVLAVPDADWMYVLASEQHACAFRTSLEDRMDSGSWKGLLSSEQLISLAKYQADEDVIELVREMSTNTLLSHDFDQVFIGSATINLRVTVTQYFQCERADIVPTYNSKLSTGMVGLRNQGATCYLNGILQMLYHINEFRNSVYQIPVEDRSTRNSSTLALQSVFKMLQLSPYSVSTNDLTAAFGWTAEDAFLQQDAQELMGKLLERIQQSTMGSSVDGFVERLFSGRLRSFVKCVGVPFTSNRDEDFSHIQLDVKGCSDIYESLRKFVQTDKLDGENKYDAGEYGKLDAEKGVIFLSLPPVLTIVLKRFAFDVQRMGFVKVHDHHHFPENLSMRDFIAEEEQGKMKGNTDYVLHSVLVHTGDVGAGHYYTYIRPSCGTDYGNIDNMDQSGWYRFNDDKVCKVSATEALEYNCGVGPLNHSLSSAYMLLYVRVSEAKHIMGTFSESIPTSLLQKLEAEEALQRANDCVKRRTFMYMNIFYFDDSSLKSFHGYDASCDFVNETVTKKLHLFKNSTNLGVVVSLLKKSQRPICSFRLWDCELRRSYRGSYPKSVLELDAVEKEYSDNSSDEGEENPFDFVARPGSVYFIDQLKCTNEEDTEDEVFRFDTCLQEQEDLAIEDTELMESLRSVLVGVWPGIDGSDFNCIADNNAACCQWIMELLIDHNSESNNPEIIELDSQIQILQMKWKDHIFQYYPETYATLQDSSCERSDNTLCFVKLFDPLHLFPKDIAIAPSVELPAYQGSAEYLSKSRRATHAAPVQASDTDETSESGESSDDGMKIANVSKSDHGKFSLKPSGGEQTLPLKYLATSYFHPLTTLGSIITYSLLVPLSNHIKFERANLDDHPRSTRQSKLQHLKTLEGIIRGDFVLCVQKWGISISLETLWRSIKTMGRENMLMQNPHLDIPPLSLKMVDYREILTWPLSTLLSHISSIYRWFGPSPHAAVLVIESRSSLYHEGIMRKIQEVKSLGKPYADYRLAITMSNYTDWWNHTTKSITAVVSPFDSDTANALKNMRMRQKDLKPPQSGSAMSSANKNINTGSKRNLVAFSVDNNGVDPAVLQQNGTTAVIVTLDDGPESLATVIMHSLGFFVDDDAVDLHLIQEFNSRLLVYVAWSSSVSPTSLLLFSGTLYQSRYKCMTPENVSTCCIYYRLAPIAVQLPSPGEVTMNSEMVPIGVMGLNPVEVFLADSELRKLRAEFLRVSNTTGAEKRRRDFEGVDISSVSSRQWPQKVPISFEGIAGLGLEIDFRTVYPESVERVYSVVPHSTSVGDFIMQLRLEIGLPLGCNEFVQSPRFADSVYGDVVYKNNVIRENEIDICTDETHSICSVVDKAGCNSSELTLISDLCQRYVLPAFPLALLCVCDGVITVISPHNLMFALPLSTCPDNSNTSTGVRSDLSTDDEILRELVTDVTPPCWYDYQRKASADACDSNYYAVQHISHKELIFMRNQAGTQSFSEVLGSDEKIGIRSVPIFVHSFILHGSASASVYSGAFPRPFLSYICDDDNIDSLLSRFAKVSGEQFDFTTVRLAVIKDRLPSFLQRIDQNVENTKKDVWKVVSDHYSLPVTSGDCVKSPIVRIGIQRSASKINQRWHE